MTCIAEGAEGDLSMDLIDRQAAIDEIKALYEWHDTVTEDRTIDHLKRLPSAQPDYIMTEWCTDCKEYDQERHCCPRFNRVIRQTLSEQTEIIYCKDCKHQEKYFHADGRRKDGGYYIFGCELADGYSHVCLDDDFCSRAERREE